jgi:hypothetical protein
MSSGYTARVKEGISFEEFAIDCSRAFGALIHLRDEPMERSVTLRRSSIPSYHANQLVYAKQELDKLEKMSLEDAALQSEKSWEEQEADRQKTLVEKAVLLQKYQVILASAEAWIPPTPEHENMKKFMIEQLTSSIEWDCSTSYYDDPAVKETPEEWLANQIVNAKSLVEYHEEHLQQDIDDAKRSDEWVDKLCESLNIRRD